MFVSIEMLCEYSYIHTIEYVEWAESRSAHRDITRHHRASCEHTLVINRNDADMQQDTDHWPLATWDWWLTTDDWWRKHTHHIAVSVCISFACRPPSGRMTSKWPSADLAHSRLEKWALGEQRAHLIPHSAKSPTKPPGSQCAQCFQCAERCCKERSKDYECSKERSDCSSGSLCF